MSKATHGHQGGNAWGPCQEPGCGELLAHLNHEVAAREARADQRARTRVLRSLMRPAAAPCVEDCADNAAGDFDHVHED